MDYNRTRKNNKQKREFSKTLLIQESVLIWIVTLSFIAMAFMAIKNNYLGSLPWLAAFASCPWVAYGVSQACYYNKSKAENTINGIKYDTMIKEHEAKIKQIESSNTATTVKKTEIDPWGPI